MKSVNKNFGFFLLIILSLANSCFGEKYLSAAFLIAALFYDAITAKEKAE